MRAYKEKDDEKDKDSDSDSKHQRKDKKGYRNESKGYFCCVVCLIFNWLSISNLNFFHTDLDGQSVRYRCQEADELSKVVVYL